MKLVYSSIFDIGLISGDVLLPDLFVSMPGVDLCVGHLLVDWKLD